MITVQAMKPISYARHRFPPDVIRHAVWLYLRFTLSYRDVEDLLAERGLTVSNESIRRWVLKFGPVIAKNLRGTRPKPHSRWHLDEMVVSIAGRQMYMRATLLQRCWRVGILREFGANGFRFFMLGADHALQASFERQTLHSPPASSGHELARI